MSAWSHLPNARHIDRVLASLKANPEAWDATRSATRSAAWTAARSAAWTAARDAVAALIAWDDCAHLLDSEPEEVRLLAALGVNAAILLYPASLVFSKEKELA